MKRNCEKMDTTDNAAIAGGPVNLPPIKKLREEESSLASSSSAIIDIANEPSLSDQTLLDVFRKFVGSGQHNFVEREPNPAGHSLVNPDYVGKKTYHELMELDGNLANASQFVVANMGNRVEQIGRQMRFLHENLQQAIKDTLVDSDLHMVACNFVKKPGHTYHLYERLSGQKYFSMLSPEEWYGNTPHKFLGSWYLESDQSWTPAEKRRSRYEGISFLSNLYSMKSIQ